MYKCCFCGIEIDSIMGCNDPRPIVIADDKTPVCCDDCNAKIVIPTRVFFIKELIKNE